MALHGSGCVDDRLEVEARQATALMPMMKPFSRGVIMTGIEDTRQVPCPT